MGRPFEEQTVNTKTKIIGVFAAWVALMGQPAASFNVDDGGEVVDRIAFADQIDDWKLLDNRHAVVKVGNHQNYLLTFTNDCYRLSWAQHVGVSSSNNTIYAGFDYVTADGWQCPIESIRKFGL